MPMPSSRRRNAAHSTMPACRDTHLSGPPPLLSLQTAKKPIWHCASMLPFKRQEMRGSAMDHAYIYDGLRTPIGRHAGGLAPVRPDDLLGGVIKELVRRNPFEPRQYEDAVVGCTNQAGEDARNVARHAALLAALPNAIGGLTAHPYSHHQPPACIHTLPPPHP